MKATDFLIVLLFAIFLTLKLVGVIDWSWWWISAPLWGPMGLWCMIVPPLWWIKYKTTPKIAEKVEEYRKTQAKTKFALWVEGAKKAQEDFKNRKA